ncbi:MAG: cysteine hydrolase family protein [Oscillospiraceae bacterium]|jgi:nicotinamidase-related amidase
MKLGKLDPKTTAVLVIDMQHDFLDPDSGVSVEMGRKFLPKMAEFLDKCRAKGVKLIYSQDVIRPDQSNMGKSGEFCEPIKQGKMCVEGSAGAEIDSRIAPKDGDILIKKQKYSFFFGTDLLNTLQTLGIKTTIITGVCTDCCVFQTARDAGQYNFDVGLLSDLTGTVGYDDIGYGSFTAEQVQACYLTTIALTTADVMTSDDFLSRLI